MHVNYSDSINNTLSNAMPPEDVLENVAELFKIFGDLTRVRIIFVLFQ